MFVIVTWTKKQKQSFVFPPAAQCWCPADVWTFCFNHSWDVYITGKLTIYHPSLIVHELISLFLRIQNSLLWYNFSYACYFPLLCMSNYYSLAKPDGGTSYPSIDIMILNYSPITHTRTLIVAIQSESPIAPLVLQEHIC